MPSYQLNAKPVSSAEVVIARAKSLGAKRIDDTADYIREIYRLAPLIHLSPDWLVAQSSHETGFWTSPIYVSRLNVAGIGVTDGEDHGYGFPSGQDAARAQILHLWGYVYGRDLPALLVPYKALDPRWSALITSGWAGTVKTVGGLAGTWASDLTYETGILKHYRALIGDPDFDVPVIPATGVPMANTETITHGNVPMFGYIDHYLQNKREGFGWDNLGKRQPKFVTLHRMWGTMAGTLSHFSNPNVSSITDFAIAAKVPSGETMSGIIYRYNDPLGYRAGWASGPVSSPYGDGKAIVDKYGINAVNRDGISIETDGYDTPFDDVAWDELVHFVAYWADFMRIPYTSWPVNPATGISGLIWHNEFTDGTGKECPFSWMRANTDRLIADVKAYLQKYQTGVAAPEPSEHTPPTPIEDIPKPEFAQPRPIKELALLGEEDEDTARALVIANGTKFRAVFDQVEAIRETKRLQVASVNAAEVGPPMKEGERADVMWLFEASDGHDYYYSDWATRFVAADFKRIND